MRTAHPPRKKRKQSNKDNLASKCCACSCQDSCGNRNKKKTKEKEASLLNILKLREFENIDIRSRIEKKCLRNMNIIRDNEGKFIFSDAIYNLEFSTDDKIVLSGGANEEVSIYDSCFCSLKKVGSFKTGHEPGVNGIKFLDSRLILTCSDDKQIALWDIRNTAERVSTLQGHESWVKSMSFNNETKTLISSAFDDTIRLWNIDKYQQDGSIKSDVILKIPFLVRTEFSKDFTKLVVSTTTGLLLFFDNIDLDNLSRYDDTMKLLEPRQIEKGKLQIKMTKSNDLTIVEKFPEKSRPYCIGSTILSSNSNCVFSRYNTRNTGEWSVLHSFDGKLIIICFTYCFGTALCGKKLKALFGNHSFSTYARISEKLTFTH